MNEWKDEQKNYPSFETSTSKNFYIGLGLAVLSSHFIGGSIRKVFFSNMLILIQFIDCFDYFLFSPDRRVLINFFQ